MIMENNSLFDRISKSKTSTYITDRWKNGKTGSIVDLKGDYVYRFVDYIVAGESVREKYKNDEEKMSCPIVACGIVGYWLKHHDTMGNKGLFESYYDIHLKAYERKHGRDDDAWERNLTKEFSSKIHIVEEKRRIKVSEAIFDYLPDSDCQKILSITQSYQKFARAKRKELNPPQFPENRIIEDTFFTAYKNGGARECVEWFRYEYDLPQTGHHIGSGKPLKEAITGKMKEYYEVQLPELILEEFEDFDDSVLMRVNGGMMDEIQQNLDKCGNHDDRERYIASILQPFKDFAEAFYATGLIREREKAIEEDLKLKEYWEKIPDDAIDDTTGKLIEPKKQIAACVESIDEYRKDIEHWKHVEERFYVFAQHGLTKEYAPEDNNKMCMCLGKWWWLMIQFSRRLAALALTYGIKLMDIQDQCAIYINWTFDLADYIDYKYISSLEQAEMLLSNVKSKKSQAYSEQKTEYEKILQIVYDGYSAFEKLPPDEIGEVALRNLIVVTLQTNGYYATAETYNKRGKTDICIKSRQGTDNLFISECKIWHGEQKLYEAVNQLFTRYLTWHDTDAALIIFVESGDFTKTIVKVRTALSTHPLFKCSQKAHIEKKNVFSCALHHSDDNDRLINLEVMLFHFPKRVSKAKPTNKRK